MENKRESVILIPIASAELVIGNLRIQFDPSATHGIPAHITILFPFKHPDEIKENVSQKLKRVFSECKSFDFKLEKINTFPGVVFLEPSERYKFIEITKKVTNVFPENLPYERKFTDINPHLTIGHKLGERFDECLKETGKIADKLPISVRAEEIYLMTSLNGEWIVREKFLLM